jgi:hypothetical protein
MYIYTGDENDVEFVHSQEPHIEATRGASTSSGGGGGGAWSTARPTSAARTSVRQASVSKSRGEEREGASPRSVPRPGQGRHHHRDPDAWMIGTALPDDFKTPFDQTAALAYGAGTYQCYSRCRSDCEAGAFFFIFV